MAFHRKSIFGAINPKGAGLAFYSVDGGLYFPTLCQQTNFLNGTMDAATEKVAHIGRLYLPGRTASSVTLSAAGGGSCSFRCGTTTFANGSTSVEIGLQDVDATNGPICRPDNTFDVSVVLTGGGGGLSSAAWNTVSMTGGSGSKTLNHGDLIAVVWDMTAVGGVDSVTIAGGNGVINQSRQGFPLTNVYVGGAWSTTATNGAGGIPNVVINFDDGTRGYLVDYVPTSVWTQEIWADADNPDERGIVFQVPWTCKIDALWFMGGTQGATGDFTIQLYSDPTGTPSTVSGTSISVLAENLGVTAQNLSNLFILPSEVQLTRATDYCLAIKNTSGGAGQTRLVANTLGSENYREMIPNGSTIAKATRNNSSGAFSVQSPATTYYGMGVRISSFQS